MNQGELRAYLDRLIDALQDEDQKLLYSRLESLTSVFLFNGYEYR